MPSISEPRLAELWQMAVDRAPEGALGTEEQRIVSHFAKMYRATDMAWESAPSRAVLRARAIMQAQSRRIVLANILRPNLATAVRGATTQLAYETDEINVRLQIERSADQCRVWGRVSDGSYSVWTGEVCHETGENGDFEIECSLGDLEPLSLQNGDTVIVLPMEGEGETDGRR